MLAPNPDDRPQTGQEVANELTEIARQFGIESSAPHIAYALTQVFPPDPDGSLPEIAQILTEDRTLIGRDGSVGSVTDGSMSSSRRQPLDVSHTYPQRPNLDTLPRTEPPPRPARIALPPTPPVAALPRPQLGSPPRRAATRIAVIIAVAIVLIVIGYVLGTR
ncbi:MAG TPA: hypothetical protein VGC42_25080, partial [Kofleriaceae bacterium]